MCKCLDNSYYMFEQKKHNIRQKCFIITPCALSYINGCYHLIQVWNKNRNSVIRIETYSEFTIKYLPKIRSTLYFHSNLVS